MKLLLSLLFCLLTTSVVADNITKFSKHLGEKRKVSVSLPVNYHQNNAHYPVMYVLDGNWYHNLVETTLREANRFAPLLPEFIVVSIHNTNRWQDFTFPSTILKDTQMFRGPHKAVLFQKYLKTELIPQIEREYRVNKHRLAFGYSLGGGFLLNTLTADANLFSHYMLVSPYLKWNDDAVLKKSDKLRQLINEHQIKLVTAIAEDEDKNTREPNLTLYNKLKTTGLIELIDYEGENHTSMPNASLFKNLRAMYADWFPDRKTGMSMNALQHVDYFRKAHEKYFGESQIQKRIYDVLITWFGSNQADLKKLCDLYKQDHQQTNSSCHEFL